MITRDMNIFSSDALESESNHLLGEIALSHIHPSKSIQEKIKHQYVHLICLHSKLDEKISLNKFNMA